MRTRFLVDILTRRHCAIFSHPVRARIWAQEQDTVVARATTLRPSPPCLASLHHLRTVTRPSRLGPTPRIVPHRWTGIPHTLRRSSPPFTPLAAVRAEARTPSASLGLQQILSRLTAPGAPTTPLITTGTTPRSRVVPIPARVTAPPGDRRAAARTLQRRQLRSNTTPRCTARQRIPTPHCHNHSRRSFRPLPRIATMRLARLAARRLLRHIQSRMARGARTLERSSGPSRQMATDCKMSTANGGYSSFFKICPSALKVRINWCPEESELR